MLYPTLETCHYTELSGYRELLYDDVNVVRDYDIQVIGHNKVKSPTDTFIEYAILTESSGRKFRTQKRYSDFEWLMNYLYQRYPYQILPPMPPKRYISTVDKFSRAFIDKRQLSLNAMMHKLCGFKDCINDERTQTFLCHTQKEFDQYKAIHQNPSAFTKFRISVKQFYRGTILSLSSNDWKDSNTVSYVKIMNKRAFDRSIIMSILECIDDFSKNWEEYSMSLLLLAQDLSDVVLLMKKTELTPYIDGTAQLLFNLSTEGKLHCSFVTATIQPIMFEYLTYNDNIIRTIKRRNRAKATYYTKSKSLQLMDTSVGSSGIQDLSKGNQFDELTKETIMLEDNLKQFDDTFVPDFCAWQRQRSRDIAQCLNIIVTSNLKYHKSCLDMCKHAINKIRDNVN